MDKYVIHLFDGEQKTIKYISYDRFINIGDGLEYKAIPNVTFVVTEKTFIINRRDRIKEIVLHARPKN